MNSKIKGSLFVLAMFSLTAAKCGDDEPVPAPQSLGSQMKDAASQYAAGVKESTVNFATEYPKTAAAAGAGAVLVAVPVASGVAASVYNGVIGMAKGAKWGLGLEWAGAKTVGNGIAQGTAAGWAHMATLAGGAARGAALVYMPVEAVVTACVGVWARVLGRVKAVEQVNVVVQDI